MILRTALGAGIKPRPSDNPMFPECTAAVLMACSALCWYGERLLSEAPPTLLLRTVKWAGPLHLIGQIVCFQLSVGGVLNEDWLVPDGGWG